MSAAAPAAPAPGETESSAIASAESVACPQAKHTATRLQEPSRFNSRCVRWSRAPLSTLTRRRNRDTVTSAASNAGSPTITTITGISSHPNPSTPGSDINNAARVPPMAMLPPSPRKIRAPGLLRL